MKVLQFSASWCAPCRALKTVVAGANLNIEFEYVDVDANSDLAMEFKVRGVPTLVLVDDEGKEVKRKSGLLTEAQLREFIGE